MAQSHADNIENSPANDQHPVLRLANPFPDRQYQNDNDNNMYYTNDNSSYDTEAFQTANLITSSKTSSFTNLTGTATNQHPLMNNSPTSPASPVSVDFPDVVPERKPVKTSSHKKPSTRSPKLFFKPEAHSSNLSLYHHCENMSNASDLNSSLENSFERKFNVDLPTLDQYEEEVADFPESPTLMKKSLLYDMPLEISQQTENSDTENDKSMYEAVLSPNLQIVSLNVNEKYNKSKSLEGHISHKRRKIRFLPPSERTEDGESDVSSVDSISESLKSDDIFEDEKLNSNIIQDLLESPEEIEDSVFENLSLERSDSIQLPPVIRKPQAEPIEEYTALEERRDSRHWQKISLPNGEHQSIDMRVIEPYKRVLSHGGYLKAGGHNAIVVFSACFLPDKSRVDYAYVMDNLFLYVLWTLDQLVTEDYVLVYLHGGAGSSRMPTFAWLRRCYQLIDRRLRKTLKHLYLVHPTFWLKTLTIMCKPLISSKFYRKISFVNSLSDLFEVLPIEQASIPEKVKNFEKMKFSC